MKIFFLLFILFVSFADAHISPYIFNAHKNSSGSIKILDVKNLDSKGIHELSDLAYKKGTLYALSDRGFLYNFKINIKHSAIKSLKLKNSIKLKNHNRHLQKMDTEGLDFMGNNLLISYEQIPKIELRTPNGKYIKKVKIHKNLRDISKYVKKNKALEAVSYDHKYGVITAPEVPLKKYSTKYHILYAQHKKWKFKANGAISAIEFMSKNEVMILQRTFKRLLFKKEMTLSKLNLKTGDYEVLGVFSNHNGWNLDNFEGLTKVSKNRYLMISDDNGSYFQKTLLVLFEVI